MTRVHNHQPRNGAHRSTPLDQPRAALKKKKDYKIVLEAVTQEKKKLHSILTYASDAPPGFGFIPAGHPELTEWCKEQCRQRRLDVHIVSAKPKGGMHHDPGKLSHHVHRVGHHFPILIIDLACVKFDYTYDEVQGLRRARPGENTNWFAQRVKDYSSRQAIQGVPVEETIDYIRGAVRELFPKIPEVDLTSIVNHAFKEGTRRIGNAKDIVLSRRIQLAVGAHIRHTCTDYDKLLKTVGWAEARRIVEPISLAKLLEWRDEAGEDSHELEETFREVIIIDDEDMSSDDDSIDTPDERDQSMEIVYSRATAWDLQPERHSVYPRIDNRYPLRSRRTIVVQPYPPPPRPAALPGTASSEKIARETNKQNRQAPARLDIAHPRNAGLIAEPYELLSPLMPDSTYLDSHFGSAAPLRGTGNAPFLREIDGQLYELQPIEQPDEGPRVRPMREHNSPSRIAPASRPTQRWVPDGYVHTPPNVASKDVVLPSVESEFVDLTSPRREANTQRPFQSVSNMSGTYSGVRTPKRKARSPIGDLGMTRTELNMKRPRPVYREDEGYARTASNQGDLAAPPPEYMDSRGRPQGHPLPSPSELTYSPQRSLFNGDRGAYPPIRSYPVYNPPVGHAYVNIPAPHPHPREIKSSNYETYPGGSSRAYVPDYDIYERRPPPPREYISATGPREHAHLSDDRSRFLRDGLQYGSR